MEDEIRGGRDVEQDDLLSEIRDNLRVDREKLTKIFDKITEEVEESLHPELIEGFTSVSEVLTKNTAQMIELAKLHVKKSLIKDGDDRPSDVEADSLFNTIENDSKVC